MNENIYKNHKEINEIKTSLNYNKLYNDMDKRLSVIELLLKKKRGALDHRILFWILLAILLYLFLKSVGILP